MVIESGHLVWVECRCEWRDFPHVCPGKGCAIQRWLQQQKNREIRQQEVKNGFLTNQPIGEAVSQ